MEVTYVSPTSVRIKGKSATLVTNVLESKKSLLADADLLLGTIRSSQFTDENVGVIFQGAGEYEIKGTKVTGFSAGEDVMFTVAVDGMSVFVGNVTSADKAKDKLHEHDVAVLIADEVLNQTVAGVLNASVVIFVGEKAEENMKSFGKESAKVNKYAVTKDKLPTEAEFVLLG